ncbi:MAG: type II toxin-antitoxin system VapB family antitoxin [bacterium]
MTGKSAKLFKNGRNQAVRIPRELEFEGIDEVMIRREGNSLVLTPKRKTWTSFAELSPADDDFMEERPDLML